MRWILTLCVICLFSLSLGRFGFAEGNLCPHSASVKVTVRPVFANPVFDFSAGLPELQRLANDKVHKVRQGWALGLTLYKPVLEMDAPVLAAAFRPCCRRWPTIRR